MNEDEQVDNELLALRRTIANAAGFLGIAIVIAAGVFAVGNYRAAMLINDRLATWEVDVSGRQCCFNEPVCIPVGKLIDEFNESNHIDELSTGPGIDLAHPGDRALFERLMGREADSK